MIRTLRLGCELLPVISLLMPIRMTLARRLALRQFVFNPLSRCSDQLSYCIHYQSATCSHSCSHSLYFIVTLRSLIFVNFFLLLFTGSRSIGPTRRTQLVHQRPCTTAAKPLSRPSQRSDPLDGARQRSLLISNKPRQRTPKTPQAAPSSEAPQRISPKFINAVWVSAQMSFPHVMGCRRGGCCGL